MHHYVLKLSRAMAYLGGLMLCALIVLTCVSIIGRLLNGALHGDLLQSLAPVFAQSMLNLGIGPVQGDFELVEAGMAFAVFAFLPWCQVTGGHAAVDIFTAMMPKRVNRMLACLTDVVFAAVLIIIAVQLFAGMQSKMRSGQTTFLLEFPLWWAYALSLSGAGVAAAVGVYVAAMRTVELAIGRDILPATAGAEI